MSQSSWLHEDKILVPFEMNNEQELQRLRDVAALYVKRLSKDIDKSLEAMIRELLEETEQQIATLQNQFETTGDDVNNFVNARSNLVVIDRQEIVYLC